MKVLLHDMSECDGKRIKLSFSFGNQSPQDFYAMLDRSNPDRTAATTDYELFMRLSDLSHKRFGNCVVYQLELLEILKAFRDGKDLPEFPAQLGTTEYCKLRPGRLKIIWNKLAFQLHKLRFWWGKIWSRSSSDSTST